MEMNGAYINIMEIDGGHLPLIFIAGLINLFIVRREPSFLWFFLLSCV